MITRFIWVGRLSGVLTLMICAFFIFTTHLFSQDIQTVVLKPKTIDMDYSCVEHAASAQIRDHVLYVLGSLVRTSAHETRKALVYTIGATEGVLTGEGDSVCVSSSRPIHALPFRDRFLILWHGSDELVGRFVTTEGALAGPVFTYLDNVRSTTEVSVIHGDSLSAVIVMEVEDGSPARVINHRRTGEVFGSPVIHPGLVESGDLNILDDGTVLVGYSVVVNPDARTMRDVSLPEGDRRAVAGSELGPVSMVVNDEVVLIRDWAETSISTWPIPKAPEQTIQTAFDIHVTSDSLIVYWITRSILNRSITLSTVRKQYLPVETDIEVLNTWSVEPPDAQSLPLFDGSTTKLEKSYSGGARRYSLYYFVWSGKQVKHADGTNLIGRKSERGYLNVEIENGVVLSASLDSLPIPPYPIETDPAESSIHGIKWVARPYPSVFKNGSLYGDPPTYSHKADFDTIGLDAEDFETLSILHTEPNPIVVGVIRDNADIYRYTAYAVNDLLSGDTHTARIYPVDKLTFNSTFPFGLETRQRSIFDESKSPYLWTHYMYDLVSISDTGFVRSPGEFQVRATNAHGGGFRVVHSVWSNETMEYLVALRDLGSSTYQHLAVNRHGKIVRSYGSDNKLHDFMLHDHSIITGGTAGYSVPDSLDIENFMGVIQEDVVVSATKLGRFGIVRFASFDDVVAQSDFVYSKPRFILAGRSERGILLEVENNKILVTYLGGDLRPLLDTATGTPLFRRVVGSSYGESASYINADIVDGRLIIFQAVPSERTEEDGKGSSTTEAAGFFQITSWNLPEDVITLSIEEETEIPNDLDLSSLPGLETYRLAVSQAQ